MTMEDLSYEGLSIDQLAEQLNEWNITYRNGDAQVPDEVYDSWEDELKRRAPKHPFLQQVGAKVDDSDERKQQLPTLMASMEKVKSWEEWIDWRSKSGLPHDADVILTPKYDGISLVVDEENGKDAWTRGDGEVGLFIPQNYSHVPTGVYHERFFSCGELIYSRKNFFKYDVENGGEWMNGRNTISGKAMDKGDSINPEMLGDAHFMRYILVGKTGTAYIDLDKEEQLKQLNKINEHEVPYIKCKAMMLTEELLEDCFKKWSEDYEIDGIIIDVNDHDTRQQLGRNTKGNPNFAVAYKGAWEDSEDTVCTDVTWQVSKKGHLKPVIHVEPVKLNGAVIRKLYGDNARFLLTYGIGKGTKLCIKRSGMVIPRIVAVHEGAVFTAKDINNAWKGYKPNTLEEGNLTSIRKKLGIGEYGESLIDFSFPDNDGWDGVELKASGADDIIQEQRMVAFFEILKIEQVSDSTVKFFMSKGLKTIKAILSLTQDDMSTWEGWGERKASIVYNHIHSKLKDVDVNVAQHASGLFYGLGSKKLALVKHFDHKPTMEELAAVNGFAEKSAEIYLNGYDAFWEWVAELPITLKMKDDVVEVDGDKCHDWKVVFTGFRDKDLENKIVAQGGEIKSGISKNSTHLIMAKKGSGTSKEKKAVALGQVIMDKAELERYLNVNITEEEANSQLW